VTRLNAEAEIAANPWMTPGYQDLFRDEQRATAMHVLAENVVPGLLQTEAYARIINADDAVGVDVPGTYDDQASLRMRRKVILDELATMDHRARAQFVLTEAALRFKPEGMSNKVLALQAESIADMAEQGRVEVRVIPAEAQWPLNTRTITRYTVPVVGRPGASRRVLHVETGRSDSAIIPQGDIAFRGLIREVDRATSLALEPDASIPFLRQLGRNVLWGK
jgi:hypothetical protein